MHARFPTLPVFIGLALMFPLASLAASMGSGPLRTDHLTSQLVAQSTTAVAGQPLRLGLRMVHDPHWHTYWRNPGDSGLATRIELELPAGVTAGEIEWPAPRRFAVEGIINFGYAETLLLPITLQVAAGFAGASVNITAHASWLVCEVECVPGRGSYQLQVPIADGPTDRTASADPRWIADFDLASKRQPRSLEANAGMRRVDEHVLVDIHSSNLPPDIAAWEIFPLQPQIIVNGAYPMWTRLEDGMRMRLPISEAFTSLPARSDFLLVKDDQALIVNARVTPTP